MTSEKGTSTQTVKKDDFEPDFAKYTLHEVQSLREEVTQIRSLHSDLLPRIISHYRTLVKMTDEQRKSVDSIRAMLKEMKEQGRIIYQQTGESTFVPASTHFNPGIVYYPKGNMDNSIFIPVVPEEPKPKRLWNIGGSDTWVESPSTPESSPQHDNEDDNAQ